MKRNLLRVFVVIAMVLLFASTGLAKDKVIKWKVQGFVPAGMLYHDTSAPSGGCRKESNKRTSGL